MAKISNTVAYPSIQNLAINDYLVITDADNKLMTKSVTVEQLQGFFGLDTLVAKVTVTSAALLPLASTTVTLIPAAGVNKAVDIISIAQFLDAGTQQFDFGNDLEIKIGATTFGTLSAQSANFATDLVSKIETGGTTKVIAPNTDVTLTTAADATQGNGTMYFNIFYRVLNVDSTF